ncbi:hypothetical protein M569_10970, partial [Genlisea aurea]
MEMDYNPSRKSFVDNKWVATVASIWIQCTSGSLYTFTVYSPILKSTQGYDQSTLDTVSVFKDLGANIGILSGLLYTPAAPWRALFAGAVQCFAGYLLIWLTVTGALPPPPAAVMCFYMFLAAHAMTFFNTADVVSGVHNFPNYRGVIVGIMKGFLGLSGAVLIQVYQTIFKNNTASYILLLALLPSINAIVLMGFVRTYQTCEEDEKKYLNRFSVLALLLAAYLTAVTIFQHIFKLKSSLYVVTFVFLVLLLVFPVLVAVEAQRQKSYRMVKSLLEQNQITQLLDGEDGSIITSCRQHEELRETNNGDDDDDDDDGEDKTLLQSMKSINFWFLFYTTACGMGSGLATVNNISQIGESLGYSPLATNTLVSLWSIWNFLGRFGAGYISDSFLHLRASPRPLFVAIALAAMSAGHALIACDAMGRGLYVGSVVVGIGYGSQWSLMPTVASELFGKAHMGTIFNTITAAGPVGSYVLSVRVVGRLYDEEAAAQGGGEKCIGSKCFMASFLIMGCVCFSGFVVALCLMFRTRRFY